MNIATITGVLRLNDQYSPVLAKAAAAAEQAGAKMEQAGARMTSAGGRLTVGLTAPIITAGAAAFKFSTDFNKSMANVASLIPGNITRVEQLKKGVQTLAIETGKSTDDLAGGLYMVVSAFGDTNDTLAILNTNARAATAGLSTTEEAINLTSAVTKGYGDTSAAAVAKAADLAQMTVRLGQTTFPELAASVGRVTPLTAELKISQEELFAVMATGTGVTGKAAEVSTQLRGILQSLMAPTESVEKLLGKMGISSGKALIEQKGLHGAISLLVGEANRSGQPLNKYISSIEGQTLALALAGAQSDTYKTKLGQMGQAQGEVGRAFDEQTNGINKAGFLMDQLRAKASVYLQEAGDRLVPSFIKLGEALMPLLDRGMQLLQWFSSLPQPVQTGALALVGLAAAIGPLLMVLGTLISTTGTLIKSKIAMRAALFSLNSVLLPLVVGFGTFKAVAAALDWVGWTDKAERFWGRLMGLTDAEIEAGRAARVAAEAHINALNPALDAATIAAQAAAAAHKDLRDRMTGDDLAKQLGRLGNVYAELTAKGELTTDAKKRMAKELITLREQGAKAVGPLAELVKWYESLPAAAGGAGRSTKGLNVEMQKLIDESLTGFTEKGQKAIATAMAWASRVKSAGDVTKLTASQQVALHGALSDVVDEYGSLRAAGLGAMQEMFDKTSALVGATAALRAELAGLSTSEIQRFQLASSGSGGIGGAAAIASSALLKRDGGLTLQEAAARRSASEGILDAGGAMGGPLGQAAAFASRLGAMGKVLNFTPRPSQAAIDQAYVMVNTGGPSIGGMAGGALSMAALATRMASQFKAAPPSTAGSRFGDVMGGMPATIMGTLQGGGNVSGSIGASFAGFGASELIGKFTQKFAASGIGKLASGALSSAMPVIGGLVAPMLTGLIGKLFGGGEKKEAQGMASQFVEQMGGLEQLTKLAKDAGVSIDALMSAKKKNVAESEIKKITAALQKQKEETERLERAIEKYGLSWKDAGDKARASHLDTFATDLVADHDLLIKKGYDTSKVIAGMSGSINQFLNDALTTHQQIPASMAPMIQELIRTGKLTEENARLMLGMGASGVPAFADVQAAAERYGISIDSLGPKVKQLEINESAQQIVADFELMVAAGGDVGAILVGMKDKAQGYIDHALKGFVEIPASMRPMLEQMVAAGLLTDASGEKLKDLAGVKFAEPLSEAVDRLLSKLDELIDTLTGKVEKAMGDVARDREFTWRGKVEAVDPETGLPPYQTGGPGFALGTGGRYMDFGTETNVRLHGRQRVVTEHEGQREAAAAAMSTAVMESRLASIERALREQPNQMYRAMRDAQLQAAG